MTKNEADKLAKAIIENIKEAEFRAANGYESAWWANKVYIDVFMQGDFDEEEDTLESALSSELLKLWEIAESGKPNDGSGSRGSDRSNEGLQDNAASNDNTGTREGSLVLDETLIPGV